MAPPMTTNPPKRAGHVAARKILSGTLWLLAFQKTYRLIPRRTTMTTSCPWISMEENQGHRPRVQFQSPPRPPQNQALDSLRREMVQLESSFTNILLPPSESCEHEDGLIQTISDFGPVRQSLRTRR